MVDAMPRTFGLMAGWLLVMYPRSLLRVLVFTVMVLQGLSRTTAGVCEAKMNLKPKMKGRDVWGRVCRRSLPTKSLHLT